eukprot:7910789-Karenia_brevis.AAC.1
MKMRSNRNRIRSHGLTGLSGAHTMLKHFCREFQSTIGSTRNVAANGDWPDTLLEEMTTVGLRPYWHGYRHIAFVHVGIPGNLGPMIWMHSSID